MRPSPQGSHMSGVGRMMSTQSGYMGHPPTADNSYGGASHLGANMSSNMSSNMRSPRGAEVGGGGGSAMTMDVIGRMTTTEPSNMHLGAQPSGSSG